MSFPKVVLLGDSLTQFCFSSSGRWGSLLGDRLQRVADVVCRGYSGYNTKWILNILPEVFGELNFDQVAILTILLGSNDCAHKDDPYGQGVPVDEYRQNLKDIVHFMTDRGLEKDKIILMTPPPFHVEQFTKSFASHRSEQFKTVGPPLRNGQLAEEYALNCAQVGHELQLDTVDLHTIFTQDSRGTQLFSDGLHFSGDGSKLLFDSIWPLVEKKVLKHTGQSSLAMKFPNWSELASH